MSFRHDVAIIAQNARIMPDGIESAPMNNLQTQLKSVKERPKIPFVCCRLELPSGDIHVGEIESYHFVGNELTLVLRLMVKVIYFEPASQTKPEVTLRHRGYKMTFEGCRVIPKETTGTKTKLQSATGDTIVLTSDPQDIVEINDLIRQEVLQH